MPFLVSFCNILTKKLRYIGVRPFKVGIYWRGRYLRVGPLVRDGINQNQKGSEGKTS